jgi:signal transduction histidine kinase
MNTEKDIAAAKATVDQLNQQAWELRVRDSNRSLILSNEALRIAKEIDYPKGKAEGLRTSGFCQMRLSNNAAAKKLFEESLQLYQSLNDAASEGYIYLGFGIIERNLGSYKASLEWLHQSLELITQTNYREVEPLVFYHTGITYKYMGNLEQALEYILKSLAVGKAINDWIAEAYTLSTIGSIYEEMGDGKHALDYHQQSLFIRKKEGDKWGEAGSLDSIGTIYFRQGNYQMAEELCQQSLVIAKSVGDKKGEANTLIHLAQIHHAKNDDVQAFTYSKQSLVIRETIGDKKGQAEIYLFLAGIAQTDKTLIENTSEQLIFLNKALALAKDTGAQDLLLKIHHSFYKLFKLQQQYEKALEQLELSNAMEKEIHSNAFNQKILNLEITHKIEQSKKEAEIYRLRNVELADLYEESTRQKNEIQATFTELKATQAQLIQSEKMASLGELTAGIAHEIQNPLNFVNNFSEVNIELIEEMRTELTNGNPQMAMEIANDIKENEEKITYHGKRADAIVKGMLQHSRSRNATKEPTNINALSDEYLRLSYHGLRAKDKSFNATLQTDFDESIGKINIVPQDIGRVILNLINNAFYAVNERQKAESLIPNAVGSKLKAEGVPYEPIITITTKKLNDTIEISVIDNGNGIPDKIKDKIFQPFFTTKPTGQGTGLGLSLAYDIIKAHGGELKVASIFSEAATQSEKQGTTFIISLPMI